MNVAHWQLVLWAPPLWQGWRSEVWPRPDAIVYRYWSLGPFELRRYIEAAA